MIIPNRAMTRNPVRGSTKKNEMQAANHPSAAAMDPTSVTGTSSESPSNNPISVPAATAKIATVGVSRDDAWRLKALLEMIRDVRLPAEGEVPRLDVWVEPLDTLWYTASAAKQSGMLAQTRLALHIELPRAARTTYREAYTTVLADFLIQSAALLLPPAR